MRSRFTIRQAALVIALAAAATVGGALVPLPLAGSKVQVFPEFGIAGSR